MSESWQNVALAAKRFGLRPVYSDHGLMLRRGHVSRGHEVDIPACQLLFWLDRGDPGWQIMRTLTNNWAITPEVFADHEARDAVCDMWRMARPNVDRR